MDTLTIEEEAELFGDVSITDWLGQLTFLIHSLVLTGQEITVQFLGFSTNDASTEWNIHVDGILFHMEVIDHVDDDGTNHGSTMMLTTEHGAPFTNTVVLVAILSEDGSAVLPEGQLTDALLDTVKAFRAVAP